MPKHIRSAAARPAAALAALAVTALAAPAHAEGPDPATVWGFDPVLLAMLGAAAWAYIVGAERLAGRKRAVPVWRQAAFWLGLVAVYAALQSPLDRMAGHLYALHAVQQLLLRVVGPLLLAVAVPQSALIAGMTPGARRWLARHLPHRGAVKRTLRALARPFPAGALFIGTLYLWSVPPVLNAALQVPGLHVLLNATAFAAGLFFFLTLFDPRDPPVGAPHGRRQIMLISAALSQIVLGAALTLKPMVVYTAFDAAGRMGGMTALADEATGGFVIWTPTCLILLSCIIAVVVHWNGAEERRWARAQRGGLSNAEMMMLMPQTADELWMVVTPKNRRTALGLSAIPLTLFVLVFALVAVVRAIH